ncbi:MAG: FMN-binding protein [Erysipelotrichaceae bacterium]|nr:FMN-binding protein [Erysipelotrichaceae bacterium]
MKKILTLVLFLGIVSAISGLVLGYVNSVTEPLIQEAAIKAEKANLELMYPGADFTPVGDKYVDGSTILGIYEADGQGYIFKLWGKGYSSSGITILVGFDYDGTIQKLVPLEQQETNGFGAENFKDDAINSLYIGKTLDQDVDLRSGSTVTSKAMQGMIAAAKAVFPELG